MRSRDAYVEGLLHYSFVVGSRVAILLIAVAHMQRRHFAVASLFVSVHVSSVLEDLKVTCYVRREFSVAVKLNSKQQQLGNTSPRRFFATVARLQPELFGGLDLSSAICVLFERLLNLHPN